MRQPWRDAHAPLRQLVIHAMQCAGASESFHLAAGEKQTPGRKIRMVLCAWKSHKFFGNIAIFLLTAKRWLYRLHFSLGCRSIGRTSDSGSDNQGSSPCNPATNTGPHRLVGPGQRPFTPSTGVQIPLGTPSNFKGLEQKSKPFFICGAVLPHTMPHRFDKVLENSFMLNQSYFSPAPSMVSW